LQELHQIGQAQILQTGAHRKAPELETEVYQTVPKRKSPEILKEALQVDPPRKSPEVLRELFYEGHSQQGIPFWGAQLGMYTNFKHSKLQTIIYYTYLGWLKIEAV
jgi:hypothetical protein